MPAHKRLKHKRLFDELFKTGNSLRTDAILMVYKPVGNDHFTGTKAAFSVSKRKFKRAVDRNRIKRLMREAWRLNCTQTEILLKEQNIALTLIFVYIFNEPIDFISVQDKVRKLLNDLSQQLAKKEIKTN